MCIRWIRRVGAVLLFLSFCLVWPNQAGAGAASLSKSPIVVGTLDESSGIGSADLHFPSIVAPAAVKWINAHGGIDGHPLVDHVIDTESNPSNGIPDAQTLVEQDHVVALVGDADSEAESAYAAYLTQQKIPVIGAEEDTGVWTSNPYFFSVDSAGDVGVNSFAHVAQKLGDKKLGGVAFADCPPCAEGITITAKIAPSLGEKLVSTQLVPFVSPDYTAICLALKQSGAQFLFLALATSNVVQMYEQCKLQGYTPFYGLQGSVADGTLGVGASKGILTGGEMEAFPWFSSSTGAAQFRAAMKKYEPGKFYENPDATATWTSFMVFRQALLDAHVGSTVTNSDVLRALYSVKGLTLGGLLAQPVTYKKATPPIDFHCYFVVSQTAGKWKEDGTQCLTKVISPFTAS